MVMFFMLLWCFPLTDTAPVRFDPIIDEFALKKLKDLGYLEDITTEKISALQNENVITEAIKRFQKIAYIEKTGVIDDATRTMLLAPRCGVPDFPIADSRHRKRRFAPQGTKWNNNPVTWQLENSNNDGLTDTDIRKFVQRSLQKWADVANIDFLETPNAAIGSSQIRVRFATGTHSDQFPFDGPSGTLAHAFFPLSNQGLSGDIHFDDDEVYTFQDTPRNSGTIKFLWVAVHELGHSLGLSHSDIRGAIMYPFYLHFPGLDFNLTADDVAGLQTVYGARPTTPKPVTTVTTTTTSTTQTPVNPGSVTTPTTTRSTTTTTTTTTQPSLCPNRAKAMILWNDETTYMFNSNVYYVIGADGLGVESTGNVRDVFSGLQTVDAVHRRQSNDKLIVLFHGDSFSIFDNQRRRVTTPRKIYNGYLGLPEGFADIDDAFVWPGNNKLYMFKGELYWRFTQLNTGSGDYLLDFDYPMDIFERWIGVPNNIDAVFTWKNGKTYFIKDDVYYRFDDTRGTVTDGYPQQTSLTFLKCTSPSSIQIENLKTSYSTHLVITNKLFVYTLLTIFVISYL